MRVSRPDGCTLYLEEHGRADGSPLLLLEGLGGDIPGWRRNVPRLAKQHRVLAFDLRGNGRSTMPDGPLTMSTFVDDAVAVLDDRGVARAHVYGQSLGGMIAQEMALTFPARVRSLVLAATHAGPANAVVDPSSPPVPKDRPYLALYSEAFAREHPEHVLEDVRVGARRPQAPSAGRRQWEAMRAWSSFERLGQIRCPVLVLHGTQDRVVPVANARVLAERIPGATLVLLEGAGHVYHSEQPIAADTAVLRFLASVDRGAS